MKDSTKINNNVNFMNGKQYPYGFKKWLRQVAIELLNDTSPNVHEKLDPESWFTYFMQGHSPQGAVTVDIKEGSEL